MQLSDLILTATPPFFLCCAFGFLVPQIPKAYTKWKKTEKTKEFTNLVFAIFFSVLFIFPPFAIYTNLTKHYIDLFQSKYDQIFISLPGVLALYFITIPQAYQYFRKFTQSHKPLHFTLMIFFSLITMLLFSALFIDIFQAAIKWM